MTIEYIFRIYYDSAKPRDYPFNVTFVANTPPYFGDTSLPTQVISCETTTSISVSTIIDDEGDAFKSRLDTPTIPFTAVLTSDSSNQVDFSNVN